ncbi:hypothetical protein QVD17_02817 [Tagetes erecta]|uniref:Glutaredoxin domain-containing protein n=1 Tax=Tagetes erecta TaxID=13708 RepID=A0AAD8L8X0_TARER|nr:hypothetical protein QVD17_02817 [Tagetes erecta]
MWKSKYHRKSSREIDGINVSLHKSPSKLNFIHSYSSFKDVETLFAEDDHITFNKTLDPPSRRLSIFHRVHLANKIARALQSPADKQTKSPKLLKSDRVISVPELEKRIVVYTTSLRVVRSTFEACRTVQSILRGFRVPIDERDLSMDSKFLNELQTIMAENGDDEVEKTKLTLPRVFINGRYVGGAEEVKQLHETGELKKIVEGLPVVVAGECDVCGGYRFILCDECRGSHKCYNEKSGFRSCTLCNENGLIRCTFCL